MIHIHDPRLLNRIGTSNYTGIIAKVKKDIANSRAVWQLYHSGHNFGKVDVKIMQNRDFFLRICQFILPRYLLRSFVSAFWLVRLIFKCSEMLHPHLVMP